MKTVYLVRHAKSSWDIGGIEDRDRPLKGRGIRDAHLISEYLYKQRAVDHVHLVSSPATRALHTALIFAKNFGIPAGEINIEDVLYLCSAEELGAFIQGLDNAVDVVYIFSHNPGILQFVNKYTAHKLDHVPTTGVVSIRYDVAQWEDAQQGELLQFEYPKRLKANQ